MIKKYVKKCEHCGKTFVTKSERKKYCSKSCRIEALKRLREEKEQLCWRCQKACGACNWSKHLLPIEGWEATEVVIKDFMGDFTSYKIKKCPEFICDERGC